MIKKREMTDIFHSIEQVLLPLSYKDTMAMCLTNRMYSTACVIPGFFERKAKAKYGMSLESPVLHGSSPKQRYMVLEELDARISKVAKRGLGSLFAELAYNEPQLRYFMVKYSDVVPYDFDEALKVGRGKVSYVLETLHEQDQGALLHFLEWIKATFTQADKETWNYEISNLFLLPDLIGDESLYSCIVFRLMLGTPLEKIIDLNTALGNHLLPGFIDDWFMCKLLTRDDILEAYNWAIYNTDGEDNMLRHTLADFIEDEYTDSA